MVSTVSMVSSPSTVGRHHRHRDPGARKGNCAGVFSSKLLCCAATERPTPSLPKCFRLSSLTNKDSFRPRLPAIIDCRHLGRVAGGRVGQGVRQVRAQHSAIEPKRHIPGCPVLTLSRPRHEDWIVALPTLCAAPNTMQLRDLRLCNRTQRMYQAIPGPVRR